jgi:hypothetical protein
MGTHATVLPTPPQTVIHRPLIEPRLGKVLSTTHFVCVVEHKKYL